MSQIHNHPRLKQKRRDLRNNSTPAEIRLWNYLKNKQLNNRKFRRQHSIGNFIVDFYCPCEKLVIELDGSIHSNIVNEEYDANRTKFLNSLDIKVIRFKNDDVFNNIENVMLTTIDNFNISTTPSPPNQEGILRIKKLKT